MKLHPVIRETGIFLFIFTIVALFFMAAFMWKQ
jgi:hypothetical protein